MILVNKNNQVVEIKVYKGKRIIDRLELVPNLEYQILIGDKITCHEENVFNKYIFKRDKYYNYSYKTIENPLKNTLLCV